MVLFEHRIRVPSVSGGRKIRIGLRMAELWAMLTHHRYLDPAIQPREQGVSQNRGTPPPKKKTG